MKKGKTKSSTIVASYESDLSLVLNWLRLNKAISATGEIYETKNGQYAIRVKHKKPIKTMVSDKFGTFAIVK